jgi:asparagine synthase (glutamine-hydrolysing)
MLSWMDPINFMLYLDVKGLLPGDMLSKVDRMSMANSLRGAGPFPGLYLRGICIHLEGQTPSSRQQGAKAILLQAFADLLPPLIQKRPKWGFEMPIGAWFRKELYFLVDEYLDQRIENRACSTMR